MSEVLKSDRQESPSSFYYEALRFRKKITDLLLRDFGVKDKIRTLKDPLKTVNKIEYKFLTHIYKKYNCKSVLYTYPDWMISFFRSNILKHTQELIDNITIADNINPYLVEEVVLKRLYFDKAICSCKELLQDMQFIIDILPVDANKYIPFVKSLKEIKKHLKVTRSKDNIYLRNIKSNQLQISKKVLQSI